MIIKNYMQFYIIDIGNSATPSIHVFYYDYYISRRLVAFEKVFEIPTERRKSP